MEADSLSSIARSFQSIASSLDVIIFMFGAYALWSAFCKSRGKCFDPIHVDISSKDHEIFKVEVKK